MGYNDFMKKAFLLFALFLALPAISHAQSVDLLWQADTYTPPFYKGRALWSSQSSITLMAIPNGLGNTANLNYRWTRNGTVLGGPNGASGVGKNSITYSDSILGRSQTFKVEIVGGDQSILASASVSLTPIQPMLAVYENSPLYGFLFNREAGSAYELSSSEVTLAAFPFFFSSRHRHDGLVNYEWHTNSGETQNSNSVTYRTAEGAAGSSQISIRARNPVLVMQDVGKNLLVRFGNN